MTTDLKEFLESKSYFSICEKPCKGICALERMAFTTGLWIGLTKSFRHGRYCYENLSDAKSAINSWDGSGDPPGNWIKYKGIGGERMNINYVKND